MAETAHLVIENGKDSGRQISIPANGARLGRSSRNDIVIEDPVLSRYHCRLFFKPEEGLWVCDLGSANDTLVNGSPVQEARLRPGDRIAVGDTILKVLEDSPVAAADGQLAPGAPVVDLGLAQDKPRAPGVSFGKGAILLIACLAILAAAVWLPKLLRTKPAPEPAAPPPEPEPAFEVDYEKIVASSMNIFRYKLLISADGMISVQIDDIENDRHVRKEKPIDKEYAQVLARSILDSGFFTLAPDYQGIQPGIREVRDLSVTIGRKTHRTRVVNRLEPDIFRSVRERIEQCGKSELGLWAIQFSPEKLVEMAEEAFLLAKKLYDEREIKYGNLAAAIRSHTESEWYLETVEPKPEFYPELVAGIASCKRELQEKFDNRNFLAKRAIRLGSWEEAASHLRIMCELVPDRADARNKEARKELLDVEQRLKAKR